MTAQQIPDVQEACYLRSRLPCALWFYSPKRDDVVEAQNDRGAGTKNESQQLRHAFVAPVLSNMLYKFLEEEQNALVSKHHLCSRVREEASATARRIMLSNFTERER
ncbi:hypothetical protein COOONC_01639 [Cooperia oncophora]